MPEFDFDSPAVKAISFSNLIELGEWPLTGCSESIKPVKGLYYFVSHRWLSPTHPDPDGRKFQRFREWHDALRAILDRVETAKHELCNGNCRSNSFYKLLYADRLNCCPLNSIHVGPANLETFQLEYHLKNHNDADCNEEFAKFFLDLTERITLQNLNCFFWIDSYSVALEDHRKQHPACERDYQETLPNLSRILSSAAKVIFFNGFENDELERGWILLEIVSAAAAGKLSFTDDSQGQGINIDGCRTRFLVDLDFECTVGSDKELLVLIHGLNYLLDYLDSTATAISNARQEISNDISKSRLGYFYKMLYLLYFPDDYFDEDKISADERELVEVFSKGTGKFPEMKNVGGYNFEKIRFVFHLLFNGYCIKQLEQVFGESLFGGSTFINIVCKLTYSFILAERARTNTPYQSEFDPQDVLQACIVELIFDRENIPIQTGHRYVVGLWQSLTGCKIVDVDESSEDTEYFLKKHNTILGHLQLWASGLTYEIKLNHIRDRLNSWEKANYPNK